MQSLSATHNRTGPFARLWEAETRYAQLLVLNASALPDDAVCDGLQAFATQHRATAPRRAPVHKLVLKSAAHRSSAGFLRRDGRLGSLSNTTSIFHMTHIAKTGGRSVKQELNRLVRCTRRADMPSPRNRLACTRKLHARTSRRHPSSAG